MSLVARHDDVDLDEIRENCSDEQLEAAEEHICAAQEALSPLDALDFMPDVMRALEIARMAVVDARDN